MPGIPLPTPIPVTPFTPDPSEPTYSQIFDETMGNLATPDDGMDANLLALASLNPPDGGNDTSFSGPQLQIASIQATFKLGPGSTFATGFASAIAAGNVKYGTFAASVGPSNQSPPGITPPGAPPTPGNLPQQPVVIGQPDPNPYPPIQNIPQPIGQSTLPAMGLNDPQIDYQINQWTATDDGTHWSSTKIWNTDADIFSTYAVVLNTVGSSHLVTGHLVVHPVKVGRFQFVIQFFGTDVTWLGTWEFDVTVVTRG